MEVVVEPIRRAVERTAESHGALIAILRPRFDQPAAAQAKPAGTGQAQAVVKAPAAPAVQNDSAAAQTGAPAPESNRQGAPDAKSAAQLFAEKMQGGVPAAAQERGERAGEPQQGRGPIPPKPAETPKPGKPG
jgi:hypothetical protein